MLYVALVVLGMAVVGLCYSIEVLNSEHVGS